MDIATPAIAAASTVAYAVIGLYAARSFYSHMRAKSIDGTVERTSLGTEWAVKSFNEERGMFASLAVLGGALWPASAPLVYLGAHLMRWFDATTPKSRAELKAEHDAMQRRIRELERDLKIGA